jgi:hypothetical protein
MEEPEIDPYTPPAAEPVPVYVPVRPTRVLVIGLLFCTAGVLALGSMIWGFSKGRLDLNPMALMLLVGIGVLRGRTNSQWWATLWLIFGYGLCGVLVVAELAWPGQTDIQGFGYHFKGGYPIPGLFACCLIPAVGLITLHVLLSSRKSQEWFRQIRLQKMRERLRPGRAAHRSRPGDSGSKS